MSASVHPAPLPANLYVHVPFCDGKCRYCAFYSVPSIPPDSRPLQYASFPAREARLRGLAGLVPATVYFGGGTPGMLGPEGFERLVRSLRDEASIDLSRAEEWTVELTPTTATPALLAVLRRIGVNRISIGAQSFHDATLRRIGRRHDAHAIREAVAKAREAGFRDVGLDLIAGLPGVAPDEWRETVEAALALDPVHLSVYALTLEEGTPFARDARAGRLPLPGVDEVMDLLAETEDRLAEEGFERYEVSNYARPGYRCKHNLAVWRGEDYAGLGPAASSRIGNRRRTNAPDLARYEEAIGAKALPPAENDETFSPTADAEERFLFGLRLSEGVFPETFAQRHPAAVPLVPKWERVLASLVPHGLVSCPGPGHFVLTRRGREVTDAIIRELL